MPVQVQYTGVSNIDALEGVFQAVWSRIIDLGMRPDTYHPGKMKNQFLLVWQLAETCEFGGKQVRRHMTAFVSNSINSEKSTLHKYMVGTLGADIFSKPWPSAMTLDDMLIGKNCMLSLSKKTVKKDGIEKIFSQIDAVAPLMKGIAEIKVDPLLPIPAWVDDYIRNSVQKRIDASAPPIDMSAVLKSV